MSSSPTVAATDLTDVMFAWCHTMLDTQPIYLDGKQQWQVFSYAGMR